MTLRARLSTLSLIATLGACVSPTPASAPLDRARDARPACPEAAAALPAEVPPPGSYDSGPGPKIGLAPPPVFVPPADCLPTQPER